MGSTDPLLASVKSDETREVGGVQIDIAMHAHVGFMARGQINVRFADGCVVEHKAPQFVSVEPGHQGWVVGDEPAVLIEFDFEGDTVERLAVPTHQHG